MSDYGFTLIEQHIQILITLPKVDQDATCHKVAWKILFTECRVLTPIFKISL